MTCQVVRAVRGAITVEENSRKAIDEATQYLLKEILKKNKLNPDQIISSFFTLTQDLNAGFPAAAARKLPGWDKIPMLCAGEAAIPGELPMCIRVMLHCYSPGTKQEIKHVYLRRARVLRPDLSSVL